MKKSKKVACCLLVLTTSLIMSSCDKSQVSPTDPSKVVTKVEKTSSDENKDTYTITFADGSTFTFTVEHGKDGQDGEKGETGPQGPVGQRGEDGVSIVSVDLTSSDGLVDIYTITYSDGTSSNFIVTNGKNGEQGIQGIPGQDGHTPVITISSDGYWVIDGVKTNTKAQGEQGEPGKDGTSLLTGNGEPSANLGKNGDSYIDLDTWDFYVKTSGTWIHTGNIKGEQGNQGTDGTDGEDGNGIISIELTSSSGNVDTYTITYDNGDTTTFTVTNGVDGEKGETGPQGPVGQTGEDGLTPKIGENGNWWIGETDTGVSASGQNGEKGNGIKEIKKTDTQGNIDTYTIYFTDGTTFTFTVTNGTTAEAKYYAVNFDLNNGEYISDIDVSKYTNIKEGSTILLPDVYREGYTFEGWYTGKGINDTRFTSYSQVNSNLTLVAKWAKMTYDGQTALTDDIRKETKRYFASMYDIYLKGEVASSNYSKYLEFIGLADFVADDNEANELIEQFVNWFYTLPVDHAMIEADLTIINEYYQNISYNYPQIAEMFNDRYNSIISQYEVATTVGEYIECVNQINSLYNDVINEINNLGNIDQERENAYNDITSQYENISSYNPFIVNYESDYQEVLNIIQTAKTSDDIQYAYERFNELTSSADTDYNIATNSRDSLVNNLNQAYEMYNSQFELSEEDHISYQDLSNQLYDDKNLTNLDYLTGEVSIYIERLQTNYGELDLTSKKEELINDLDYKIEDLTNQFGEDKLQNYLETFESYRTTINESNSILELLNLQNDINNYYEQIYNELSFDYEYRDNILNNLAESWNVLTERFGKTSLEEYQSTYDYYYELVSNCTNTDELYKYENEINEFLVYVTENLENQYESLRNELMNQFVSELENITQQLNNLYDLSSDEKYGPLVQEAINNLQSLPVDELDDYYANTIEPLLSELSTYKDEILAKAVYIQFYPEFPVIGLSLWLTSSPKPYFVGDTITLTQEDLDNMFAPVSGFSVDKVYLDKEHQQEINLTEGVYLDGETYLAQQTYYFYMTYVITDLDLAKQTFNQILVTIKENMATYYPTYEESLTAIADKYMAMLDTISTPEDLLSAMEEYNSEMLQVEIGIFVEQMQMSFDELSKQNPDVLNYQDEFDGYVEQIKGATSEQELSNIINEFNDFIMQFYEIPIETNA